MSNVLKFRNVSPEPLQICSKCVKMLNIIIDQETENLAQYLLYFMIYDLLKFGTPIAVISVCSFLAIFKQAFLQL